MEMISVGNKTNSAEVEFKKNPVLVDQGVDGAVARGQHPGQQAKPFKYL